MTSDLSKLARTAAGAISDFGRAHVIATALGQLEGRGELAGVMVPYTDSAIAELSRLYANDSENITLLHHLAIARHSRAWDWELAGDARAAKEWEAALTLWRRLQTSPDFWQTLAHRLGQLNPAGEDSKWLAALRASLLEQLIGVHANFVLHWTNEKRNERARTHAEIIRKAEIPPVARDRLKEKVFRHMTGGVADARERGDFGAALGAIEAFLDLFPEYPPALRLFFEVSEIWMDSLVVATDWDDIEKLARRGQKRLKFTVENVNLNSDPLLKPAIMEWVVIATIYARKKGDSLYEALGEIPNESPLGPFQLGYEIGGCLMEETPADSRLRCNFRECAVGIALTRRDLSIYAHNELGDGKGSLKWLKPALALLHEGQKAAPNERVAKYIQRIEADLETLKAYET